MIIGITGVICAGKNELVRYLVQSGFEAVNIMDLFKNKLQEQLRLKKATKKDLFSPINKESNLI
jgi:dephospho-CoA kinase